MILEYLFLDKIHRAEIEKYKYHYDVKSKGKITRTIEITGVIQELNKNDCWILRFEMTAEDEKSARYLSEVNDEITKKYSPLVLKNESSAHFNKTLYPLVNTFERELRRFLYLKSSLITEEIKKEINDLESKDFGEIYTLLFVDNDFCKKVKENVNGRVKGQSGIYTKREIINRIQEYDEKTLWDEIAGDNILIDLKENFDKMIDYRNDVMHAHNINYEDFKIIKKLYKKVNKQLEAEINKIIESPDSQIITKDVIDVLFERLTPIAKTYSTIDSNSITLVMENLFHIFNILCSSTNKELVENEVAITKESNEEKNE